MLLGFEQANRYTVYDQHGALGWPRFCGARQPACSSLWACRCACLVPAVVLGGGVGWAGEAGASTHRTLQKAVPALARCQGGKQAARHAGSVPCTRQPGAHLRTASQPPCPCQTPAGNLVALLAEDEGSFGKAIGRQLLRTRRNFTATVFSPDGEAPAHGAETDLQCCKGSSNGSDCNAWLVSGPLERACKQEARIAGRPRRACHLRPPPRLLPFFRALRAGQVIFRMRRPMYLINSSIFVEVPTACQASPPLPQLGLPAPAAACLSRSASALLHNPSAGPRRPR